VNKISRYDVLRTLARGSSGEVLLAFDPVIQREVALKTLDRDALPAGDVEGEVGRFKREAIAAGRLTHPNIVTVHEYGEAGPLCFIAMEHAQGPTLREYLAAEPVPAAQALEAIARQLFSAMIYAHEQGVLHRDLKPGNVILCGDSAAGAPQVKVLDFGIARIESGHGLAMRGRAVGTPGYTSPEQYRGDPVDGRTDVYSLAVMLFEMMTGRRPFQGGLAQVLQQVTGADAPPASSMRAGLPEGVDALMARALHRDPAVRYACMHEFREAFAATMACAPAPGVDASARRAVASPAIAAPAESDSLATTIGLPQAAPFTAPRTPALARLSAAVQALKASPSGVVATAPRPLVLLLDDEERILGALGALFRHMYDVVACTDGSQALDIVRSRQPHVVVSDQRMPNMLGVDFLRQAREVDPSSVRILLTGYSDLAAIVGSVNDGEIFRFVNKPWNNLDFKDTVAQAVEIALATRHACAGASPEGEATEERRAPQAILVAQKSRELFAIVNDGFGRTRPVCYAGDVAAVLRTIEDQEVAVLLCELDGFEGADLMLKMLKQAHPQIQTVAIGASPDSSGLVSLINEAQILRFMNRPLRLGLLDRALRSALAVHANYKARPVLLQRQKVRTPSAGADSSIGRQILQRLGLLMKLRDSVQGVAGHGRGSA